MNINFITECDTQDIDLKALHSLAETVLAKECEDDSVRVTVLLTSDEVLKELNFKFFGTDEPTDVLAFPDTIEDDVVVFPCVPPTAMLVSFKEINSPSISALLITGIFFWRALTISGFSIETALE